MLNDFNCSCPVYIACGYTDLRRGIDGLASMVNTQFQLDPYRYLLWVLRNAPALSQTDETWAEKLLPSLTPEECYISQK